MNSAKEIKDSLNLFTGTEHYYQHPFGILYTDGVKFLADSCACYWLIDAVASWQYDELVKQTEFQVYKLKVNEDKSAVLNIEDGNYNIIQTQAIEYTDFPLDSIELWFTNNVCYLPSEH